MRTSSSINISVAQLAYFKNGDLVVRKKLKRQNDLPMIHSSDGKLRGINLNKPEDREFVLGFSVLNPFPGRETYDVDLRCGSQSFQGMIKAMRIEPDEKSVWWVVADIVPRVEVSSS